MTRRAHTPCRDVKCAACTAGNVSLWCAPFFCRAGTDFFIPALRLCRLAGRIYRRSARLYGLAGRMEKMWGMGEVGVPELLRLAYHS